MREFPVAAVLLGFASPAMAQQASAPDTPAPHPDGELTAGLQFQTGEYGTGARIETTSAVAGARVVAGRLILSASLPYLRIDAPGNVVPGGGLLGLPIIVDPGRPGTRVRRQGLGDLRLGVAWVLPSKALDFVAFGQVKLPTARTGLGTGEIDYAVGAGASRRLGAIAPFASITYTMPGDPEGYRLRDTWAGQAGLNGTLSARVSGQIAYSYAQSASASIGEEHQLSARLTTGISSSLSLSLLGGAGLSRSAPDATAAVQVGWRLF